MNVWVSTAGYSYPAWVGGYCPKGTTSPGLLPYYARHFPVVEIDSSFHRPPPLASAASRTFRPSPRDSY